MNHKLQTLKKELQEAQRQFEVSLASSPLTDKTPTGKTVASMRLPRLKRDELELRVKIEESREDGEPEWRIKELEKQLENIVAQVRAYNNNQLPSERYTK